MMPPMHDPPLLRGVPASLLARADSNAAAYCDPLVLVVATPLEKSMAALPASVRPAVEAKLAIDPSLANGPPPPLLLPVSGVPGRRHVLAVRGQHSEDTDDARLVAEATSAAVTRAVEAGASSPLSVYASA